MTELYSIFWKNSAEKDIKKKGKYFETIYKKIPNYLTTMNDVSIALRFTE